LLLQMVPLNEDGVFQVLQIVNKYTIQSPLPEDVLKRVFAKWWPDLHGELNQMKVPEQPGSSGRSPREMLEEILSLVRSIDKSTSPPRITITGTATPRLVKADTETVIKAEGSHSDSIIFNR
jgi:hypothetical protein